jgi:hypothetical protein
MSVLSPEQIEAYERDGCLLVSGLIPDSVSAAAEAAMWSVLRASPSDPATWAQAQGHRGLDSPEIAACYAPEFLEAAMILAGEPDGGFRPPSRPYAINVFPSEGEWSMPGPHIDHAIKEHGHKVFPRAFRIAAMTFLNDVAPHGGGTVVWPGAHKKLRALAESDPERYELMYTLNHAFDQVDLGEPVEMTPKRGDALFYHYLCPHAGSKNVSPRPRLALNMKW